MTDGRDTPAPLAIPWPLVPVLIVVGVIAAGIFTASGPADFTGAGASPSPVAPATPTADLQSVTASPSAVAAESPPSGPPSQRPTPSSHLSVAEPVLASTGDPQVAWTEGPVIPGLVRAAAWIDGQWLVGGSDTSRRRAAVWTSQAASMWSPAAPIDPAPGEESGGVRTSYSIEAFAEWEGRLVGLGARHSGLRHGNYIAMWISGDGQTWEYRSLEGLQGDSSPSIAISPDERLIIIGSGPFVSVSTDAETWDVRPLGSPDPSHWIADVAGGPPTLRAVGTAGSVQMAGSWRESVTAIWASPDWVTWEPLVTGPPGRLVALAYELEAGRFIAGGFHMDGGDHPFPAVWLSQDGDVWSPVILDQRNGNVNDVDGAKGVLLAVGTLIENQEVVIWESRDATTWAATSLGSGVRGAPMIITHGGQALLLVSMCCDLVETRTWTATLEP